MLRALFLSCVSSILILTLITFCVNYMLSGATCVKTWTRITLLFYRVGLS